MATIAPAEMLLVFVTIIGFYGTVCVAVFLIAKSVVKLVQRCLISASSRAAKPLSITNFRHHNED